jgi:hypothetical protein
MSALSLRVLNTAQLQNHYIGGVRVASRNENRVASPEKHRCDSLVDMLRDRVASRNENRVAFVRENLAYTFLKDGQAPTEEVTLGELDRRARAIATALQAHCSRLTPSCI